MSEVAIQSIGVNVWVIERGSCVRIVLCEFVLDIFIIIIIIICYHRKCFQRNSVSRDLWLPMSEYCVDGTEKKKTHKKPDPKNVPSCGNPLTAASLFG